MADIGDIVVTAHSDDSDDNDGMVPASGATASGATPSGATPSGATASGGASPPDAFEDPFEGVDPAALAAMEAAAVKAAAVDEDEYIANDPRAQERAREAQALVQASLEADKTGTRVKRIRKPPKLFAEEEEEEEEEKLSLIHI